MKKRSTAMATVLVLTGCAMIGGGQQDDRRPLSALWTADIRAMGGMGHGGFATGSILTTGQTRMNVTLDGGSAGGVHPWYIHEGPCGQVGQVVGSPEAYPELRPNQTGDASATVILDTALDPTDDYSVQIHQSDDQETLVGCGELQPAL